MLAAIERATDRGAAPWCCAPTTRCSGEAARAAGYRGGLRADLVRDDAPSAHRCRPRWPSGSPTSTSSSRPPPPPRRLTRFLATGLDRMVRIEGSRGRRRGRGRGADGPGHAARAGRRHRRHAARPHRAVRAGGGARPADHVLAQRHGHRPRSGRGRERGRGHRAQPDVRRRRRARRGSAAGSTARRARARVRSTRPTRPRRRATSRSRRPWCTRSATRVDQARGIGSAQRHGRGAAGRSDARSASTPSSSPSGPSWQGAPPEWAAARERIVTDLSAYATTNCVELFAEAFVAWYLRDDTPIAAAMDEVLRQRYPELP